MKPGQRRWSTLPALLLFLVACGCARSGDYRPVAVASPDNQWVVVASVNESEADPSTYLCLQIEIRQADGVVVYREQTSASARLNWSIAWPDDGTVHLDSSDIGDLYWERQADGSWQRAER